jgi:hypothetical protein
MPDSPKGSGSLTAVVAELDAMGYDSMGFMVDDGAVVCLECVVPASSDDIKVGGLLGYETDAGRGYVLVLRCLNCDAKGLLFAGPEVLAGANAGIVNTLADKARG